MPDSLGAADRCHRREGEMERGTRNNDEMFGPSVFAYRDTFPVWPPNFFQPYNKGCNSNAEICSDLY
jgi:hypothetical protein